MIFYFDLANPDTKRFVCFRFMLELKTTNGMYIEDTLIFMVCIKRFVFQE